MTSSTPQIEDAPDRDRYEAQLDGTLASTLEYVRKRGHLALVHTEVLPAFEGRGIGSALVRFALDDARRHPEDYDIVVGLPTSPARAARQRLARGH